MMTREVINMSSKDNLENIDKERKALEAKKDKEDILCTKKLIKVYGW